MIPGHGELGRIDDLRVYRAMLVEAVALVRPVVLAGKSADETVAARPTVPLDERWGQGFISPESFVRFVHHGLAAR